MFKKTKYKKNFYFSNGMEFAVEHLIKNLINQVQKVAKYQLHFTEIKELKINRILKHFQMVLKL